MNCSECVKFGGSACPYPGSGDNFCCGEFLRIIHTSGANCNEVSVKVTGYEVMKFLEYATMEQMENFMLGASSRLQTLAKQHVGMKHANLYEARDFALDAAKDIRGAIVADDEPVCKCERCDECVAARSDEHHNRKQDGILTKGE